jgi:hypothetical protein
MSSRSGLPIGRFVTPSIYRSTLQTSIDAENAAVSVRRIPFHAIRSGPTTARPALVASAGNGGTSRSANFETS